MERVSSDSFANTKDMENEMRKLRQNSLFTTECQAAQDLEVRRFAQVSLLRNESLEGARFDRDELRDSRLANGSQGVVVAFDYITPFSTAPQGSGSQTLITHVDYAECPPFLPLHQPRRSETPEVVTAGARWKDGVVGHRCTEGVR